MALDDQVQGLTLEADEGASGSGASDAGPVTSINFFEANKPDTHDNPLGALWDLQLPALTRAYGLRVPASCVLYVPEATGPPAPGEGATLRTGKGYEPRACRGPTGDFPSPRCSRSCAA